ncbi:Alpha/beta hydrolase fold protein [Burkholderiales bacterium]|nr:Alpha/beta hydrolase fold protein [Burkholderiales bacterium]
MRSPPDLQRRKGLLAALGLGATIAAPGQARTIASAAAPARPRSDDLRPQEAAPEQVASHWVATSDGIHLNVLERAPALDADAGQARAPTIVLLPGWCMPASIWRAQLIGLGARWRTLAMDPRGQGDSEIPDTGYTADRRADDLRDVLAGHERVVLVAWSLGVLEALHYVYRHGSDRLLALVLVDNSIGEPPAPKPSDFVQRLRRARAATVESFVRSMFAHPLAEAQIGSLRDAALRMPLESSIALLSYPLPREHWRAVAHAFDRPLAYLVTPRYREQSQHLLQARPATKIEVFEQAGHALFVDEAPRFNRLLADWIDSFAGPALS